MELRDLDLALMLARSADSMSNGQDARIRCMLAVLRAEMGDPAGAIKEVETAMASASTDEARELFAKTLRELREPPQNEPGGSPASLSNPQSPPVAQQPDSGRQGGVHG